MKAEPSVTVYRVVFDKEKLASVPQSERILFFSLGHLANEVNALNKQVLWSFKPDAEPPAVSKAQVSLAMIFLRLLAGKLKEGYILLQRHYFRGETSVSSVYADTIFPPAKEALTSLRRYFGKKNKVDIVRTHYGFHNSPEELEAGIALVPDDLEFFISQMDGNSLYYASEVLASHAMIRKIDPNGDSAVVFHELVGELVEVAGYTLRFATGFMASFIDRHQDIWVGPSEQIDLCQVVVLRDFQVPWFAFEPSQ